MMPSLVAHTGGQPSEEELAAVAEAGFQRIINLALHDDPRYSLPDEPGTVAALGMEYVHIPVKFEGPTEENLAAFFLAMETGRSKKTFLHCAANKRVSVFLGLYFAIREKRTIEESFAVMRSVWEPDGAWPAFISAMLKKHGIATPHLR